MSETVKSSFKSIVCDFKLEVSVGKRGVCVAVAAMIFDELKVLITARVFMTALEKHVF